MRTFVSFHTGDQSHASPREHVIDAVAESGSSVAVRIGDRRVAVEVFDQGDRTTYLVDGKVVDLVGEGAPGDRLIVARGVRMRVRLETERERLASSVAGGGRASGEEIVKAPMPGRVVRLLVEPGEEVAAGQTLVVVEAMKMENEVKAKGPAVVAAIHVAVGSTVEANAKLVSLA